MQSFRILLYQFYRPLLLMNVVFSCAGIVFLFINGISYVLTSLFIKLIGYASSAGIQHYFSAKEFYYYRNAGYSVKKLYSCAFLIDLTMYIIMIYIYTIVLSVLYA